MCGRFDEFHFRRAVGGKFDRRDGWLFPNVPGGFAAGDHVFQALFVFKRVHAAPEAVVLHREKLLTVHQAAEWLFDEFVAGFHEVENALVKDEEAAIHPHAAIADRLDVEDGAAGGEVDGVPALMWANGQEGGGGVAFLEKAGHAGQGEVAEAVGVIG